MYAFMITLKYHIQFANLYLSLLKSNKKGVFCLKNLSENVMRWNTNFSQKERKHNKE